MKKTRISYLALIAILLASMGALADPIDIDAGESIIFNFDFTSEAPPPPYVSAGASWSLDNIWDDGELDSGVIEVFTDLFAMGSLYYTSGWNEISYFSAFGTPESSIVDGLFSVKFTALAGSATLTSIVGTATPGEGGLISITPTLVPQPGTLALLGIGLFALSLARRRKV